MPILTCEKLWQIFDADIDAGILRWKCISKYHREKIGQIAGSSSPNHCGKKYWHVKVNGRVYKRSRLIFALANGRWPSQQVDHINGDSLDDRLSNLREATATENAWNHKRRKKNSSLPMGVKKLPSGRFNARISCKNIHYSLGAYKTPEEASAIYQGKRKELFGEFA